MDSALIDTDVIIDFLRGHAQAKQVVLKVESGYVSSITVAELYAGMRGAQEQPALAAFIAEMTVLPIDAAIAQAAGELKAKFYPSHGVGLPDALIAATAQAHGLKLLTLNVKHFPMLPRLKPAYTKA